MKSLFTEDQKPGQHRIETRRLFLLMHHLAIGCVGLKIESHLLIDKCQQRQQIPLFSMLGQLLCERLYKPRSTSSVAPRKITRHRRISDKKVGMIRNPVRVRRGSVSFSSIPKNDSAVELFSLTSLNKEQLRFPRQRRTFVCCKTMPYNLRFIIRIVRVQTPQLSMGEYGYENTIGIAMIGPSDLLNHIVQFLKG